MVKIKEYQQELAELKRQYSNPSVSYYRKRDLRKAIDRHERDIAEYRKWIKCSASNS